MELELSVKTESGSVISNVSALQEQAKLIAAKYGSLVVTEEGISAAKKDRASLNKLAKTINDERRRVEQKYMEPFIDFKKEIDVAIECIKTASEAIDVQVKDFEQREKEEKRGTITEYYNQKKVSEFVPFEKYFDTKWLNKSCKDWDVQIDEIDNSFAQDMSIIGMLEHTEEEKTELKSYYLETLSIAKAQEMLRISILRREKVLAMNNAKEVQKPRTSEIKPQIKEINEPVPVQDENESKTRYLAELLMTRSCAEAMNKLLKEHNATIKILEREEINEWQ